MGFMNWIDLILDRILYRNIVNIAVKLRGAYKSSVAVQLLLKKGSAP
jgi:hypothetical protein